jgi:hypothetical protein
MSMQGCYTFILQSNQEKKFLWYPIGQNRNNLIGLGRVIGYQMEGEVVRAIHAFVHHKNGRLNRGAFAGFENHRTDGQAGRSTPLSDFDVRFFPEPERAISSIGDLDRESQVGRQLDIAIIDHFLIYSQGGRSASVAATQPLDTKENPCCQQERSAEHQDKYRR